MLNMNDVELKGQMDPESKAHIESCIPVARKLLEILYSHNADLVMGENAEVDKALQPIAEEVLGLFLKENIKWLDKLTILQLALQPLARLTDIVRNAAEISFEKASKKKWGKDILDLTFEDIHNVLMDSGKE